MTDLGAFAMNCTDTFAAQPAAPASFIGRLSQGFGRIVTGILEWQERAEQRAHLAGMDERMRKDIGITQADALREADKPFWKA